MEPYLLTVAETCLRYRIGRTKLYELIRDGKIKAKKIGARTLIIASAVERYIGALPNPYATRGRRP